MSVYSIFVKASRRAFLWTLGAYMLPLVLTQRIGLNEINDGFAVMRSGTSIRSVIVFD